MRGRAGGTMRPPLLLCGDVLSATHRSLLVGTVVRVDRARKVGSDDEIITIEIHDGRFGHERKRRVSK